MNILRGGDPFSRVVLATGFLVLAAKCLITYPVAHVGESDASAYAAMADSIVHGRWLSVDYISFFFVKYQGLPRPEDHWPPLYPLLVAPFYLFLGETAFASKLPSLIISSLLLPLATYSLTWSFSRNRWASAGAAFTVMFYPSLFTWSLFSLSDITYSLLVCLAVLFAVKGMENGRYFYPMGFFLGLGYYAKGTALVLIPVFPIFYLLCRGRRRGAPGRYRPGRDRKFLLGILLAFLVITPWWIRNAVHFGDPLHSTQNYWSGFIGYGKGGAYKVYWDREKPSFLATKLPMGIGYVAGKTKEHMETNLRWTLLNMPPEEGPVPWFTLKYFATLGPLRDCFRDFPGYPHGLPMGFFGIPAVLGLFCLYGKREIYIVPLVSGVLLLFLSILWTPIDRLVLPTVPLVAALGWTGYSALFDRLRDRLGREGRPGNYARLLPPLLLLCGTLVVVAYNAKANVRSWRTGVERGEYPYADSKRKKRRIAVAHWLRDNTPPDSIVMDSEPWDLHFYSGRKTVHTPYDSLEKTLEVMQTYGVTHVTHSRHKGLRPLFKGRIPGFELVNRRGMKIYKVRYELLPEQYRPRSGT